MKAYLIAGYVTVVVSLFGWLALWLVVNGIVEFG